MKKPNIILITADQWRGDCIGSYYKNHPIMTPHINQLAAEGTTFVNAYADCPICMPQRATILTGKTASHLGKADNCEDGTPVDPNTSLPALLKQYAGYQTKAIGKMHFEPERARLGFEHITLHPNDYIMFLEENGYCGQYRGHGLGGNEVYPTSATVPEKYYHTNWIVDQGIKFIYQRDPNNPFFLWMVFEAPHSPFDPPAPYDHMYDNFSIDKPNVGNWEKDDSPIEFKEQSISRKYNDISPEVNKELRRRYYGQISNIDYQLGLFFGELKKQKIYDDTVIIFCSDHGELLGDHNLYGKTNFLRGSGDIPIILKVPKYIDVNKKGDKVTEPVLSADIYNTILEIANVEIPKETDGISLIKTANNESERKVICGEYGDGLGTAFAYDGKFKYCYYALDGKEQLFDEINDAQEKNNIANIKEYAEIKQSLKSEMIEYLKKYNRPMVDDNGELVNCHEVPNESELRQKNQFGLRGPLHFGQGYGGLAGGKK